MEPLARPRVVCVRPRPLSPGWWLCPIPDHALSRLTAAPRSQNRGWRRVSGARGLAPATALCCVYSSTTHT